MAVSQQLRLFRAAARNLRRENRTLQTIANKLERWLDRQVSRKRLSPKEAQTVMAPLVDHLNQQMTAVTKAAADAATVLSNQILI